MVCVFVTGKVSAITLSDTIKSSKLGEGTPDFSYTICGQGYGETTNGLYELTTDDGVIYYYRGSVDNNWVSFAGYYWRIVRVNEDGSVKIIFTWNKDNHEKEGAIIAKGKYNETNNSIYDVRYLYLQEAKKKIIIVRLRMLLINGMKKTF